LTAFLGLRGKWLDRFYGPAGLFRAWLPVMYLTPGFAVVVLNVLALVSGSGKKPKEFL